MIVHSKCYGLLGSPSGSAAKSSLAMQRLRFSPWAGKIPGGGRGSPCQGSCLQNPMDRGAWWATVHGVAESDRSTVTEYAQMHGLLLSSYSSCVETYFPTGCGCRAFESWIGHESGALMNGITVIMTSESFLTFHTCENTVRMPLFMTQQVGSHQTQNLLELGPWT